MLPNINIVKGIHPGLILGRELKKRSLARGRFALSIDEFPQTIGAIINGKRRMNTSISLKIEEALDIEEGYFMVLQTYYDIKQERAKNHTTPSLTILRRVLFWDTDIHSIDWRKYKEAVIRRVFERGNDEEKAEITRFYSKKEVDNILAIQESNAYQTYEITL